MEFNEKLQALRKSRGLTQEELAEILFVSRTTISKWELGRGYPSIDSLKDISKYFSVSIDDLLSADKLILIAQVENNNNVKQICNLIFGSVDLFYTLLFILPLYPNTINGFIYSVNLLDYKEISGVLKSIYLIMIVLLTLTGIIKIILTRLKAEKSNQYVGCFSVTLNIIIVLIFALTREVYALIIAFILLIIKGIILMNSIKVKNK